MKLHELTAVSGANTAPKRKGRGHASGNGKTAGKGHKGQKARAGYSKRAGFEGGQSPLMLRIPKRGFSNARFATVYTTINVDELEIFQPGTTVDEELLKASGLVKQIKDGVKILGDGELSKNLTVKVAAYSATAKEKIEKAGGKAEVI